MKLTGFFTFLFLFNCFALKSQLTFQKIFGPTFYGKNIQQTSDSGYVITGNKIHSMGLLRLDKTGHQLWGKAYTSEIAGDQGTSLVQTPDSGFLLVGGSYGTPQNNVITQIVKTGPDGEISWQQSVSGGMPGHKHIVGKTNDNNYFVAGTSSLTHVYCVKLDNSGNLIFGKKLSSLGIYDMYVNGAVHTNDGGFLIAGYTNSSMFTDTTQSFLVKLDVSGNFSWAKLYDDLAFMDVVSSETDFIAIGNDYNGSITLTKFDPSGEIIWNKIYSGPRHVFANSITQTGPEHYLIAGGYDSLNHPSSRRYMTLKIDSDGNQESTLIYGVSNGTTNLMSIAHTFDHGNILAGDENNSFIWQSSGSLYLIKTDSTGYSGCHEATINLTYVDEEISSEEALFTTEDISLTPTNLSVTDLNLTEYDACQLNQLSALSKESGISIYPNPFHETTTIQWQEHLNDGNVKIYNFMGQQLKSIPFSNTNSVSVNRVNLPSGIYFWRLSDEIKVLGSGKLIIE